MSNKTETELQQEVEAWKQRAEKLWGILDDIDSRFDMLHPTMTPFLKSIQERLSSRHDVMHSPDGYVLVPTNKGWQPMSTAPKDGRLLQLIVKSEGNPVEDSIYTRTIGHNNKDVCDDDSWVFAGWDWSGDLYSQGRGKPILWMEYAPKPEAYSD